MGGTICDVIKRNEESGRDNDFHKVFLLKFVFLVVVVILVVVDLVFVDVDVGVDVVVVVILVVVVLHFFLFPQIIVASQLLLK